MYDTPTSPRARRRNNVYAGMQSGRSPASGSVHSSTQPFWFRKVQECVQRKSPDARIVRTCTSEDGCVRYLFDNIQLSQIASVKQALSIHLTGMVKFGLVRTSGDNSSQFRDDKELFYVDILQNADDVLKRRQQTVRMLYNPYVFVLIACLFGMWWSGRSFVEHWRTHENAFETEIQTFKETADKVWNTMN